jgi:hypothetical protein
MRLLVTYSLLMALYAKADLALDQTSANDRFTPSSTISTEPFNIRTKGELLIAFICADFKSGADSRVQSVSSAGLNWTLVQRANVQYGSAEIWKAVSNQVADNISVTAILTQTVNASITVCTFTGADLTGQNGDNAIGSIATNNSISGAPTASLVTTRDGSWVIGCGVDYDNSENRVLGNNQRMIHQFMSPSGATYWSQTQIVPTPNAGPQVNINDVAPVADRFDVSAVEILPALAVTALASNPTYRHWKRQMRDQISSGISPSGLLQWMDNNPPFPD